MTTEEELRNRILQLKIKALTIPTVKAGDYVMSSLHNEMIDILKEMSDILSEMPIVKEVIKTVAKSPFVLPYTPYMDIIVYILSDLITLITQKWYFDYFVERADTGDIIKSSQLTAQLGLQSTDTEGLKQLVQTYTHGKIGIVHQEMPFISKKEVTKTRVYYEWAHVKSPIWATRYEIFNAYAKETIIDKELSRDADYEILYSFLNDITLYKQPTRDEDSYIERADTGETVKGVNMILQSQFGIPVFTSIEQDIYRQILIGRPFFKVIERNLQNQNYVGDDSDITSCIERPITQTQIIESSEYYTQLRNRTLTQDEYIDATYPAPDVETGSWTVDGNTYRYRLGIDITEQSGKDLTDYAVKVVVSTDYLINNGYMTSAQNEVRFADSTGATLYSHYRETSNTYWVKIPSLPANSTITIYMYFDSALTGVADASNPHAVFIFFDDMEVWSGWVQYGSGVVSQDSARAYEGTYSAHKTSYNDPNGAYKDIGQTIGRDVVLEFWVNRNSAYTGGPVDRVGLIDNNGNGYGWLYRHDYDEIGIDRRASYSPTIIASSGATDYMDKWVFAVFIIKSDGTIISRRYVDGVLNGEVSATDTNYSSFTRVYIFGGYDYWVDYMRVRPYTEPEPISQQHTTTITSTIKDPIITQVIDGGIIRYEITIKDMIFTFSVPVVVIGSAKEVQYKEVIIEQFW